MGLFFSKRWVPFHKTTRIFFEGGHTPLFFALGSDSAPGSEFALGSDSAPGSEFALGFGSAFLFVLSRCFVRFASVFRSFLLLFRLFLRFLSTFLCVDSFFLEFVWWF